MNEPAGAHELAADAAAGSEPAAQKHAWPELIGAGVASAVSTIEEERPDLLIVQAVKEVRSRQLHNAIEGPTNVRPHPTPLQGSFVSADFAIRRVRVWYDPVTQRVTRLPAVG